MAKNREITMLKKLLLMAVFLFVSPIASANICFDSDELYNPICAEYKYADLSLYFLDQQSTEHKVDIKLIFQKVDDELMHVDYDFVINCASACNNADLKVQDALWAFREAVLDDSFYIKVANEDTKDNALSTRNEYVETVSITSNIQQVIQQSQNGQQLMQYMAKATTQPILVQIVNKQSDNALVCMATENGCEVLIDDGIVSESLVNFEMTYNNNDGIERPLRRFLQRSYHMDNFSSCSQTSDCLSAAECKFEFSCIKH